MGLHKDNNFCKTLNKTFASSALTVLTKLAKKYFDLMFMLASSHRWVKENPLLQVNGETKTVILHMEIRAACCMYGFFRSFSLPGVHSSRWASYRSASTPSPSSV